MVETYVVVQDRERRCLCDCSDEEIGQLASPESVGGEVALDLLGAIETGVFATQVDPLLDPDTVKAFSRFERAVYGARG